MKIGEKLKKIREGEPPPLDELETGKEQVLVKGSAGVPPWVEEDDGEEPEQSSINVSSPRQGDEGDSGRPKVLLVDNGLFPCVAEAVAPHAAVDYFSEWGNGSPTPDRHYIGYGLKGVNRIDSAFNCLNGLDNKKKPTRKPDLVVFPDVGNGDWAHDIIKNHPDIPVFGTRFSEDLEDDRIKFREKLKELGMLVSPYKPIRGGMDNLREYLKTVKDKWVKLSLYRGNGETFYHEDYEASKPEINRLAHQLGVLDIFTDFIVEDPIEDATEIGAEWMHTDAGYLPLGMYGYEVKNKGYVGQLCEYEELPDPVKSVMDAFRPIYKQYGVRGQLSVEMRVNSKGSYFIDPCQRFASPPGESVCKAYKNLYAVMLSVAQGKIVRPEPVAKHFAQIMLRVREASNEPMLIKYPEKYAPNITMRNPCVVNGRRYFFPIAQESTVGAACGWSDDPQEAREIAMAAAKSVDGDIFFDLDVFDKADKMIEKGKKVGIPWE